MCWSRWGRKVLFGHVLVAGLRHVPLRCGCEALDLISIPAMDADAVAAYRAVEAELPVVAGFVGSADPRTSAAASWLLSWFPDRAATSLPVVLAAPPSDTRTLAAGLLGHVRGEWCAAVAAVCAGDASAYDEVVRFARTMKGAALVDESLPTCSATLPRFSPGRSRRGPVRTRPVSSGCLSTGPSRDGGMRCGTSSTRPRAVSPHWKTALGER